ncbi:MAG: transketolase C-terminal domain-containing protein [Armatimonadota bacterium]|nr:transketolase C-terminal domain-containing protein [Armatimonadota bacterium]
MSIHLVRERPQKATRDAYGEALVEIGRERSEVVVLTGDLRDSTRTEYFAKAFPERFFEVGIAEQNMAGIAAGLATCGYIPFISSFAVFSPGRNFDQIRVLIAQPSLPVKIVSTHAGITVGEDGISAQAIEDIAMMRALPNMGVVVPADAAETRQVIRAIVDVPGPVYVRLGRAAVPVLFEEDYLFQYGKAAKVREGSDATIIACGVMVAEALEAAEELASEGIEVRVLNMATIKPLDVAAVVAAAIETGAIVTAEEHNILGGLGSAVAETLGEHTPVPMKRVGIADVNAESGSPRDLMEKYGLTARHIRGAVKEVLKRKR